MKVLDFGLAKAAAGDGATADLTQSPTITVGGTRGGAILGTAAYMSPEQARGQPVDKRTDIWAFGCVLYEMLTGRLAFPGQTVSDVIAAILEREPDWSALPTATPPAVRDLLRRCLEKDPKRRLRDIGDAQRELEDTSGHTKGDPGRRAWGWWRHAAMMTLSLVAAVSLAAVAWLLSQGTSETTLVVSRTTVNLGTGEELDTQSAMMPLALSPDGRRLAYVARRDGRNELHVRELGAFEAKLLPGTEGARYPFFSPDGQSIAFFAGEKLKSVSILQRISSHYLRCGGYRTRWHVGVAGNHRVRRGGVRADAGEGIWRLTTTNHEQDPEHRRGQLVVAPFPAGTGARCSSPRAQDRFCSVPRALRAYRWIPGEWTLIGPGAQAQYVESGHIVFHAPNVREGELQAAGFDL